MKRSQVTKNLTAILLGSTILTVGCQADSRNWNGDVQQWGTMRKVLAEGKSQGRIRLADAVRRPHAYGVGALQNLTGEVTIVDGTIWTARSVAGELRVNHSNNEDSDATLLAVAYVPSWHAVSIDHNLAGEKLESFVLEAARERGISTDKPFPFMITGSLDVDAHVINGTCPHAAQNPDLSAPVLRCRTVEGAGTVVGFFAKRGGGTLTHHGEQTHMHVVSGHDSSCAGHVDRLTVYPTATLFVP